MLWKKIIGGLAISLAAILCLSSLITAAPADIRVASAARQGDLETVRSLLRQGADVNAALGDGTTALHWAAFNNDVEMTEMLLYAGANVRATTRLGNLTPLFLAAEAGSADVIETLVKSGSPVNATNNAGMTPLMLAAMSGDADAVRVLIDSGAEPNATESTHGQTALMFAAANDRGSAITGLVRGGADVSAATRVVKPPEESGRGGRQSDVDPSGGMTPLLYAAREGSIAAVRALLDGGAHVNEVSADNSTPLLLASINGHYDTAMFLLERGGDPTIASLAGATPLYGVINVQWAPKVYYPQPSTKLEATTHLELMEALLEHGADPNARLSKGLWYTGFNGGGAALDTEQATAFLRAAEAGDEAAMRLLVAAGADPNLATADGVTPLLAAAGAGFRGTDEVVAPQGRMAAVRYMVEELGAPVNVVDTRGGHSVIHHAAHRGDNEMILYLVSKGARVDIVANNGQTTADMANGPRQRVQPFPETVAVLVQLGSKNSNNCVSC